MKNVPKPGDFDYNRRMIWLRKGFVHLLSIVLLLALVGGVAALNVNRDLANPARLESRLAASGIYDKIASAALQQAEKSSSNSSDSGTVSLNDPAVQQAAASVFSPDLIQQGVNTFLNGNYDWLSGKKAVPDFNIDLTSAKESFAKQVGQAAQTHLASLPACSPQQLAQLPIPVDPLTITCRPITLDPRAEGDRVAQEINGNNDFLGNPVITPSSLNQNSAQGSVSSQPQPSQPYYQKLSWAPKAYQIGLKLPWILGALSLLCVLGIVFISPQRRRGIRRVGVVLLLAGLVLIAIKVLADAFVNKFAGIVTNNTAIAGLKQPLNDLLHQVEPQLVRGYLWSGIAFLVIAIVIFVVLFRSRQGVVKKPGSAQAVAPPADTPAPAAADTQPADSGTLRLAPRRQPTAPTLADQNSAAASSPQALPPLGKKPPRPKRPKLIQ